MEIVSRSAFRGAGLLFQPRQGAWALAVVCKATFTLQPGEAPLAAHQEEVLPADRPWDGDPRASPRQPGDLAPSKKRAEVVLAGHACAPSDRPVDAARVRLAVGPVDKVVMVMGDRYFTVDGALVGPAWFTRVPLRWERAAGGPDTSNPAGVVLGRDAVPDAWGRFAVPNLQSPVAVLTDRRDLLAPVGFGPIGPRWPSRLVRLHRHAAQWDPARWTERPLPDDFDPAYFQSAPADQQMDSLDPDERITLEGLHPAMPRIETRPVRKVPQAVADFGHGRMAEIPLRCDSLFVDADRGLITLTWRGQIALDHPQRAGVITITEQHTAFAPVPAAVAAPAPAPAPARDTAALAGLPPDLAARVAELQKIPASGATQTAADSAPRKAPLPFAPSDTAVMGARRPAFAEAEADESAPTVRRPDAAVSAVLTGLPPDVAARVAELSRVPVSDPTQTAPVVHRPGAAALPFGTGTTVAFSAGAPEPEGPSPAMDRPFGVPLAGPGLMPALDAASVQPEDLGPLAVKAPEIPVEEPAPVEAPPMWGPLARLQGEGAGEAVSGEAAAQAAEEPAPADPFERFPIERCAAIAADLAWWKSRAREILASHELTRAEWEELSRHWEDEIRRERVRGKRALQTAYDEAYLAAVEARRGAISVREYAELVVASERGTADDMAADLQIPRGAVMRIERVWGAKMLKDPVLGRTVRAAIHAERER